MSVATAAKLAMLLTVPLVKSVVSVSHTLKALLLQKATLKLTRLFFTVHLGQHDMPNSQMFCVLSIPIGRA